MARVLLVILLLFAQWAAAQPKQGQEAVDSLLKELSGPGRLHISDTTRDGILIELCYDYYGINADQGINYGLEALKLAGQLNYKKNMALAHYYLGANYCVKGDFPSALDAWLSALKINEELGNKNYIAKTLSNIGRVYVVQKKTDLALQYYNKAISVLKELKDSVGLAYTLGDIGTAFENSGNNDVALGCLREALEINKKNNNQLGVANNLSNIGRIYKTTDKFDSALQFTFEALKINEAIGNKRGMLNNLGCIGGCYLDVAKSNNAVKERSKLIPTGKKENLARAITYLNQAISYCKETGSSYEIYWYYKYLSEAEELSGNYKSALTDFKSFVNTKDSVFNTDNNIKITNLETRRDLDLKQKDIEIEDKKIALDKLAIIKNRNERGYFIAGLGLLSCIIIVIFRNYKNQQKNNADLTRTNSLLVSEKKRSDDLLLNILPEEVADELKSNGSVEAKQYDNVTVMFTDFVNFTAAAERFTPRSLVAELHSCFEVFDEIISRHGIEKIKTIGDAYVAVAGLPVPLEQHAFVMVQAAIEIRDFMRARKAEKGEDTFEVRIGIHSGNLVAGIVGVKKFAYDIWGDTVNQAARMEQTSAPGKVNISQYTRQLIEGRFTFEDRGELEAKNKGMLKMYFAEPLS